MDSNIAPSIEGSKNAHGPKTYHNIVEATQAIHSPEFHGPAQSIQRRLELIIHHFQTSREAHKTRPQTLSTRTVQDLARCRIDSDHHLSDVVTHNFSMTWELICTRI